MKPLIVDSILIVDEEGQRAFFTEFKKGINVVTSHLTSRGKSSVLRAIAYSFGAEANFDALFDQAKKIFVISFSFGDEHYRIIRRSRNFVVYKNGTINDMFSGDVTRLSRFFEEEFGFSIYLTSRNNEYTIAPPGYSFIPYFLDQDSSWKGKDTNPFKMAGQFAQDLNDIYYFHVGAIDANYGTKKNEFLVLEQNKKVFEGKLSSIKKQISDLKEYHKSYNVSISETDAELNMDLLRNKLEDLLSQQNSIQTDVFDKENLLAKYVIETRTIEDLIKKMESKTEEESITCPNCGYSFSNNEQKHYDIALIKDNLAYTQHMVGELKKELEPLRRRLLDVSSEIERQRTFYTKEENKVGAYLKSQAVEVLLRELEKTYAELSQKTINTDESLAKLTREISEYDGKKFKNNTSFKDIYLSNLQSLGIKNIDRSRIDPFKKVQISGNKYIRSTLAFFITVLEMKKENGFDNFNLPIIVDSPFEGDPDEINKSEVIQIIKDYYENNSLGAQLFIGLRDGRDYFGKDDRVSYTELTSEEDKLLNQRMFLENKKTIDLILEIVSRRFL